MNVTVDWKFQIEDRVILRDEVSELYALAPSGAEAIIKGRRIDPIGDYRMVFVEWDENHWSYNGQPNMWTFEDHFDKVEGSMAEEKQPEPAMDNNALLAALANALGIVPEQPKSQKEVGEERAEAVTSDRQRDFEATFEKAVEIARDSDAFIIACVTKNDPPAGSDAKFALVPAFFSHSLSPESALLLDAQVAEVLVGSHQALAFSEIRRLLEDQ